MRSKEDAHDYRYFPDPDLPPIVITSDFVDELKKLLPEMPDQKRERFIKEYNIPLYDAEVLTSVRQLAEYYEDVIGYGANPKKASNWIMSELLGLIDDPEKIYEFPVSSKNLAELLKLIDDNTISGKIAKSVFRDMIETGEEAIAIIDKKGLRQVTDTSEIESIVDRIIANNPQSVNDYKAGKDKALGFLVGQVMKESRGKANPQIVNELLINKLKGES